MSRAPHLTEETRSRVKALLAEGFNQKEIAARLAISGTSVWNIVHNRKSSINAHSPQEIRPKPKMIIPAVTDPSLLRKITTGRA